jgi:hypothetical protein
VALTPRGKAAVAAGAIVAVLGGGVAALALSGNEAAQGIVDHVVPGDQSPPTPCPLTGRQVGGGKDAPDRPALAVKVENTPDAQPLVGIDHADIVYEEVVEGGITRFIAVYNCEQANRVGPVRSARTTDPKILLQLSDHPLLAYSGGSHRVVRLIDDAGLVSMTEGDPAPPFTRDDAREVPHNLFVDTAKLWTAGAKRANGEPAPRAVFEYGDLQKPAKATRSVAIGFPLTPTEWRWEQGRWIRYQDGATMQLEDGSPVATDNIVIQQVRTTESDLVDVAGYPSPEVTVTGTGKAWLLRDGRLIVGTWERGSEKDLTVFTAKKGGQFQLKPGTTFVELAPTGMFDAPLSFGRSTPTSP